MRYFQLAGPDCNPKLAVDTEHGVFDLTAGHEELQTFGDLARTASIADESIDDIAHRRLNPDEELPSDRIKSDLDVPLNPDEVWAAGVTYEISEEARKAESNMSDMYIDVYDAERPEIFFKATSSRTVGHGDDVGIRGDSEWNVPEPELSIVLYRGEIIGYTIGNDVSSRDIEGENPLYLPQAKVYDRCCALGPAIVSAESVSNPDDLEISMTIRRAGETVFEERTSTAEMVRSYEELTTYFKAHNSIPELAVLMTGTTLVPPEEFTLREDDEVRIQIEDIGTLVNGVRTV